MKGLLLAAIGVTLLLVSFSPGECAWGGFGADAGRTGFTAETPTLPLSTLWKFYLGDSHILETAAAQDGRVYIAARNWLFCLDMKSGARLWEYDAKSRVHSTPLLVENRVIFGDEVGNLRALDAATGKPKWETKLEGGVLAPPLFYQGKIFVGAASREVIALQPDSGDILWTYKTKDPIGLPLAAGENTIFALDRGNLIYALDARRGGLLWRNKSETALSVSPVVGRDLLYLVSGRYLYALTMRGSILWNARSEAPLASAPAVANDRVYVAGSDGRVYCMGARNGGIKWIYSDPGVSFTATPAVAGKVVFAGGSQGTVVALEADSGKLLWRCQTRSLDTPLGQPGAQSAASQPAVVGDNLLALFNDGNLTCFSLKAEDLSGPSIEDIGPTGLQLVSGQLPLVVQARFFDEGSGLAPDSVEVYFDGEKAAMEKDPLSGVYYFIKTGKKPKETIADGVHSVTLSARDYRGNTTALAWKFATDKSLVPSERLIPPAIAQKYRMGGTSGTTRGLGQPSLGGFSGGSSSGGQGFGGGMGGGMRPY